MRAWKCVKRRIFCFEGILVSCKDGMVIRMYGDLGIGLRFFDMWE